MNTTIDPAFDERLHLFNAVSIAPVWDDGEVCEQIEEKDFEPGNPAFFWSVYVRYDPDAPLNDGFRGLECVADVPTKEEAEGLARLYWERMAAVRSGNVFPFGG